MRLRIVSPIVCLIVGFMVAYVLTFCERRTTSGVLRCSSIGATKEEILKMQGKPAAIFDTIWIYKESSVVFDKNGLVEDRCDFDGNFKHRSCSLEEKNEFFKKWMMNN